MMSDYKLTYFDIDGGRGEPIRIALHAACIAFEDIRWSFPEFGENRGALRFNAVPAIEIQGNTYTQSNAISRYIGKMAGLYPEDSLQALYCDEVIDALEDLTHYMVQTFGLQGDALKEAREALMNGRLTIFLKGLDELLTRGGGNYFADQRVTIADLKMYVQMKGLLSGNLEHIPTDFAENLTPALVRHFERMEQEPLVKAYYSSRT
jgi:glutathione S-transferase